MIPPPLLLPLEAAKTALKSFEANIGIAFFDIFGYSILEMAWVVEYTLKARKQLRKLPGVVVDASLALSMDLEDRGPIRGDWPNFSKLGTNKYHCHLKKGQPTYVECWLVIDKRKKHIEVYYVGTHEKAAY